MSGAKSGKKQRDSNIELLRIFTMLGVIVLHYNNAEIGGGFSAVESGSLNYYLMYMYWRVSVSLQ